MKNDPPVQEYPFGGKLRRGGLFSLFVPIFICGGFIKRLGITTMTLIIVVVSFVVFVIFLVDLFRVKSFSFRNGIIEYGKKTIQVSDVRAFTVISNEEITIHVDTAERQQVLQLYFDEIYYKQIIKDVESLCSKHDISLVYPS